MSQYDIRYVKDVLPCDQVSALRNFSPAVMMLNLTKYRGSVDHIGLVSFSQRTIAMLEPTIVEVSKLNDCMNLYKSFGRLLVAQILHML